MSSPNHPYQAIDKPLPPPPLADEGAVCLEIDGKWIPYLVTVLKTLGLERTWATDARRAAGEARNLMSAFILAKDCPAAPSSGIEGDDCMGCCIRVENGHLQVFSCGEWTDVPGGDLSAIVKSTPGTPEDDSGSDIPAGGCREWDLELPANLTVILPAPVSSGDIVEITSWRGTWHDGSGSGLFNPWFCADGQEFLLGRCSGLTFTSGSDPRPEANHMSIIAAVGGVGVYIGPMGSPRVIPAGVDNEQLVFLANDVSIADNGGGVAFHVKLCKASGVTPPNLVLVQDGGSLVRSGSHFHWTSPTSADRQIFEADGKCFVVSNVVVHSGGGYTAGSTLRCDGSTGPLSEFEGNCIRSNDASASGVLGTPVDIEFDAVLCSG